MKGAKWFKKSLIVLVSALTFGLVTPADFNWLGEADSAKHPEKDSQEANSARYGASVQNVNKNIEEELFSQNDFIQNIVSKGEENAYCKFGGKIKPKIQAEFKAVILPKMEAAISEMATSHQEEELRQLAITENPASGRGEKIFHIYNESNGEDIMRFHVRQENPPQEGYWFNFHYHTYHDQFAAHHDLGRIYWDKNTPPKWSSQGMLS
ncbi:YpjP family protein [Actinomycetes bacterium NPDC127524]